VGLVPAYAAEAAAATGNERLLSPRLIGRRQRRRLRRSSGEELSHSQRRLPERSDQLAPQRMRVGAIRLDPEGRDLAFGRRNVQVPNIQSHSARQLPRFLLKCAGLLEWCIW
jgi:hypothetical protein